MTLPIPTDIVDLDSLLKVALSVKQDYAIRFKGEFEGVWYDNQYAVGDLDVYLAFERTDIIQETEVFHLDKPLCVLYTKEIGTEEGSVDTGVYHVEFQLVVNFEPQGRLAITGYSQLLQALLNPRRSKGVWLPYGLAIRRVQQFPIFNGSAINEKLKDRLLIRSIVASFTTINLGVS
jgi:hypothetical protein